MVSLKQAVTYPSCATRVLVRHVNDRSVPTIRSIRRNGSNDLWIVTEKIVFSIIDQIVGVSVVVDFSFGFRRQPDKGLFLLWIKHMPGLELDGNLARDILLFSPKAIILFF